MGCSTSKTTAISLTDEDVNFLAQNTRYSDEEIRSWYKGFQKDCPDGRLTKKKFVEIYKMFFSSGSPETFCEHVFRTFDADGDGYINFKEFLLAVGVTTGGDGREKLKWAFKMYDINNDGLIEMNEMGKIIKALYDMLGSKAGALGEEGEGEGGDVDASEQSKKVQFLFDKIDSNRDGKVSLEEFIDVCNQDENLAKLLCVGSASG